MKDLKEPITPAQAGNDTGSLKIPLPKPKGK